jgi:hypothetical protein
MIGGALTLLAISPTFDTFEPRACDEHERLVRRVRQCPPHTSLKACELLTAAELESAVGGSVAQQSIGPAGSGDALSMEKVAALAEKAASRVLPQ